VCYVFKDFKAYGHRARRIVPATTTITNVCNRHYPTHPTPTLLLLLARVIATDDPLQWGKKEKNNV